MCLLWNYPKVYICNFYECLYVSHLYAQIIASGIHLSGNNKCSRSFVFTDSSFSSSFSSCRCQYTHRPAATPATANGIWWQIKMESFCENEHWWPVGWHVQLEKKKMEKEEMEEKEESVKTKLLLHLSFPDK